MVVGKRLATIAHSWFVKVQMLALRGVPDYLGVVNGRFVALELKTEDGVVDGLQDWTLKRIAKCGGFVRVVRPSNLDEVINELGEL